jgi:hypothetical protein
MKLLEASTGILPKQHKKISWHFVVLIYEDEQK